MILKKYFIFISFYLIFIFIMKIQTITIDIVKDNLGGKYGYIE